MAAIKIQALFRGAIARNRVKIIREMKNKEDESLTEEQAAIKMQSAYRPQTRVLLKPLKIPNRSHPINRIDPLTNPKNEVESTSPSQALLEKKAKVMEHLNNFLATEEWKIRTQSVFMHHTDLSQTINGSQMRVCLREVWNTFSQQFPHLNQQHNDDINDGVCKNQTPFRPNGRLILPSLSPIKTQKENELVPLSPDIDKLLESHCSSDDELVDYHRFHTTLTQFIASACDLVMSVSTEHVTNRKTLNHRPLSSPTNSNTNKLLMKNCFSVQNESSHANGQSNDSEKDGASLTDDCQEPLIIFQQMASLSDGKLVAACVIEYGEFLELQVCDPSTGNLWMASVKDRLKERIQSIAKQEDSTNDWTKVFLQLSVLQENNLDVFADRATVEQQKSTKKSIGSLQIHLQRSPKHPSRTLLTLPVHNRKNAMHACRELAKRYSMQCWSDRFLAFSSSNDDTIANVSFLLLCNFFLVLVLVLCCLSIIKHFFFHIKARIERNDQIT